MGLISWIKREKKAFNEQEPAHSFVIGGGLSVSQNRKWQKETFEVETSEIKQLDLKDIFRQYDILGKDSEGNLVVKKKTKRSRVFSETMIEKIVEEISEKGIDSLLDD